MRTIASISAHYYYTSRQGSPVRVWIPLSARYSGALLARVVESKPGAGKTEAAMMA